MKKKNRTFKIRFYDGQEVEIDRDKVGSKSPRSKQTQSSGEKKSRKRTGKKKREHDSDPLISFTDDFDAGVQLQDVAKEPPPTMNERLMLPHEYLDPFKDLQEGAQLSQPQASVQYVDSKNREQKGTEVMRVRQIPRSHAKNDDPQVLWKILLSKCYRCLKSKFTVSSRSSCTSCSKLCMKRVLIAMFGLVIVISALLAFQMTGFGVDLDLVKEPASAIATTTLPDVNIDVKWATKQPADQVPEQKVAAPIEVVGMPSSQQEREEEQPIVAVEPRQKESVVVDHEQPVKQNHPEVVVVESKQNQHVAVVEPGQSGAVFQSHGQMEAEVVRILLDNNLVKFVGPLNSFGVSTLADLRLLVEEGFQPFREIGMNRVEFLRLKRVVTGNGSLRGVSMDQSKPVHRVKPTDEVPTDPIVVHMDEESKDLPMFEEKQPVVVEASQPNVEEIPVVHNEPQVEENQPVVVVESTQSNVKDFPVLHDEPQVEVKQSNVVEVPVVNREPEVVNDQPQVEENQPIVREGPVVNAEPQVEEKQSIVGEVPVANHEPKVVNDQPQVEENQPIVREDPVVNAEPQLVNGQPQVEEKQVIIEDVPVSTTEPNVANDQTQVEEKQPDIVGEVPVVNVEPKVVDVEPKVVNVEPKVVNVEPKVVNVEPNVVNEQPQVEEDQPIVGELPLVDAEPQVVNDQPIVEEKQPIVEKIPIVNDEPRVVNAGPRVVQVDVVQNEPNQPNGPASTNRNSGLVQSETHQPYVKQAIEQLEQPKPPPAGSQSDASHPIPS